jgi:hypothetical protein
MSKSGFFFGAEHADLLRDLLNSPDGFLIYYEYSVRSTKLFGHHWCFVPDKNANNAGVINDNICLDLVLHGMLIPEIGDIEYTAQKALGTQKGRTYKVSEAFKEIFKGDKIHK